MRMSISRSRTGNVRWITLFSAAVTLGFVVGSADAGAAEPPPPAGEQPPAAADPAPVAAQPQPSPRPVAYNNVPVDENLKNQRSAVNRVLTSGQLGAGNQAKLDEYYKKYGLARWANTNYVHDLGKNRKELKNEMRMCGRSGRATAVHDYLLDLCLRSFGIVAKGNYHPASRYNAMLMIGDLNSRESSPGQTTVPLADALTVLLECFSDENQHDAVRIAALIGIRRHCELGIADTGVRDTEVYPALRELAGAAVPEGRRSPEGHAWMRVLAIQSLVVLDGLGPNGEVLETLGSVVSEEEGLMLSRCAAARAFGEFTYTDVAGLGLDPTPSLQSLGQLAQAICEVELTLLEEMKKQEEINAKRGRGGSGGGMGAMGGMGGMGGYGGESEDGGEMDGGSSGMLPGMGGGDYGDDYGGSMGGYGGFPGASTGKSNLTDTEQLRIDISKRRAWSRLRNVLFGLKGIKPSDNLKGIELIALEPEQSALLKDLIAPIEALKDELDKRDDDEEPLTPKSLEKAYKKAAGAISEILANAHEAAATAEAATADPEPAPATDTGDTAGTAP